MTEEPLIFTTKGNVPVASLHHEIEWRTSEEQVIFIERYLDGEEVVKESTFICLLKGVSMAGEANI